MPDSTQCSTNGEERSRAGARAGGIEFSRVAATAEQFGDDAADQHRFVDKRVLLTGEVDILTTHNGATIALFALRLLARTCRYVTVALPRTAALGTLEAWLAAEAKRIAFGAPIEVVSGVDQLDPSTFDAVLSVGIHGRSDLPWTVVSSHGWLARVSSTGADLAPDCRQWNPVGALGAAALGVADVFKRLIALRPTRGLYADGTPFSLFTYQTGDEDPGPELPAVVALDLLLVGHGAIGNGVVAVLAELATRGVLRGRINVLDSQRFGRENLGTCLLIGPANVGAAKATVGANVLMAARDAAGGAGLTISELEERIEAYTARADDNPGAVPSIIVNALDNVDARRAAQALWPDLMIDGAIGPTMCQVSRHPWGEEVACVRCIFPPEAGESADAIAARATGLARERLAEPTDIVRESDVDAAPAERRDFLRAHVGKPICSITSAAVVRMLSEEEHEDGFEPSVPFVACLSAAMVVGELLKATCGFGSPLECRFQFDAMFGPAHGLEFPEARHADCDCISRARNINRLKAARLTRRGTG